MTPLRAVTWTIGLWLLENVCVQITEVARPGAIADVVNLGLCQILATSTAVLAILRVHAPETSVRAALAVRTVAPLHLLASVAAGAGLHPALSTINDAVVKRWPYSQLDTEVIEKLLSVPSPGARFGLVVAAFVLMPVSREVFFRGILYAELRDTASERLAVVVTACCFAGASLDWRTVPTTLLLGLVLGWIRSSTGSIFAPSAVHVAFWAVEGAPISRGRSPSAEVVYSTSWIVMGAAIAVLALIAVGATRKVRK